MCIYEGQLKKWELSRTLVFTCHRIQSPVGAVLQWSCSHRRLGIHFRASLWATPNKSAWCLSRIPCIWPKMVFLNFQSHLIHYTWNQMMLGAFQKLNLSWEDEDLPARRIWGKKKMGLRLWRPYPKKTDMVQKSGQPVGTGTWPT